MEGQENVSRLHQDGGDDRDFYVPVSPARRIPHRYRPGPRCGGTRSGHSVARQSRGREMARTMMGRAKRRAAGKRTTTVRRTSGPGGGGGGGGPLVDFTAAAHE